MRAIENTNNLFVYSNAFQATTQWCKKKGFLAVFLIYSPPK